jgi:hypothetical protein
MNPYAHLRVCDAHALVDEYREQAHQLLLLLAGKRHRCWSSLARRHDRRRPQDRPSPPATSKTRSTPPSRKTKPNWPTARDGRKTLDDPRNRRPTH